MYSLFREKSEKISKALDKLSPASLTGFLAPLAGWIKEQEDTPLINFNGQLINDRELYSSSQNGLVMRIKDPKGGRDAHTVLNPRMSQSLISNDAGKTGILGAEPDKLMLLDTIHSGSKFDSPIIVSSLRFGTANSTTTRSAEDLALAKTNPNSADFIGPKLDPDVKFPLETKTESDKTVTDLYKRLTFPFNGELGVGWEIDNNGNVKLKDFPDVTTFSGTNARSGTTNLGDKLEQNLARRFSFGR